MSMVPTSTIVSSVSQQAHMASWSAPYDRSQRKRRLGPGIHMVLYVMHPKVDSCSIIALFRAIPERQWWWEIFTVDQLWVVSSHTFHLGKIYTDSWIMANSLTGWPEENFKNQVDRMTYSIYNSQATVSLSNGFMNKVIMAAWTEAMHGLSNMDFHSPWLIWLHILLSVPYASSRDQYWIWHHSPGQSCVTQWQIDYTGHFYHEKSKPLSLLAQTRILVM